MHMLVTFAALAAATLLLGCQRQTTEQAEATEPAVDVVAEEQALRDLNARYSEAVAAKDTDAVLAFFTEDALWTWHDGTTFRGLDEFRAFSWSAPGRG